MNGKGRPEKLTDELKQWITTHQVGQKKKPKAPAIQENLRLVIENQIREEGAQSGVSWPEKQIPFEIENRLPGISSIQKYLSELKERDKPSPLDKPWYLGLMAERDEQGHIKHPKYSISAGALQYVLLLKLWVSNNNKPPLTIRQALWASRLYAGIKKHPVKVKEKELESLWCFAGGYAWYEGICQASGTKFDTTVLDEAFIGLRDWQAVMFSLIIPVELGEGRLSPASLAWLLNSTKDKPEERAQLYDILHINTEKEGE